MVPELGRRESDLKVENGDPGTQNSDHLPGRTGQLPDLHGAHGGEPLFERALVSFLGHRRGAYYTHPG